MNGVGRQERRAGGHTCYGGASLASRAPYDHRCSDRCGDRRDRDHRLCADVPAILLEAMATACPCSRDRSARRPHLVKLDTVPAIPALQCQPGGSLQNVLTLPFALAALPSRAILIAYQRHGHVVHQIRLLSSHAPSMASKDSRVTAQI